MAARAWLCLLLCLVGCGPKSVDAKMKDADRIGDKITALLDQAERALAEPDPVKADAALVEAKKLLAEPDLQYSAEREMFVGRHAELEPQLAGAREARAAKDIEEAVRSERAQIGPSLQEMKDAAEAIAGAKVDEKAIDSARTAVATLEKAVDATDSRRGLASKDPSFIGYLKRAKGETEKARAEVTRAEKKLKFIKGSAALKLKAAEDLKASKTEKDAGKKRALVIAAAQGFGRCFSEGGELMKAGFGAERVQVGSATTSIESFLESCQAQQVATDKALARMPVAVARRKK